MCLLQNMLHSAYGLDHCVLSPIDRGTMNQCYRVEFSGGIRFLKSYTVQFYQPEQVRKTCEVQSLVRHAGLSTPEIILNTHGSAVTVVDDGLYVLSDYSAGREYSKSELSIAAAYHMGATLAHLQAVMMRLGDALPMELPDPATAITKLQRLLAQAEARNKEAQVDHIACRLLRYKIEALSRHASLFSEVHSLPAQWVHGDYQVSNLIFDDQGQVASIVDFDQLQRRPRGLEMMRALEFSFSSDQILVQPGLNFFLGYADNAALTEAEVRLFAPLWFYYWLIRPWPLDARYGRSENYDTRWDSLILPPTDWWEQNMMRVTENILEAFRLSQATQSSAT